MDKLNHLLEAQNFIDGLKFPNKDIECRTFDCNKPIEDFYLLKLGTDSSNLLGHGETIVIKKGNSLCGLGRDKAYTLDIPSDLKGLNLARAMKEKPIEWKLYEQLPGVEKAMHGDLLNQKTSYDESVRQGLTIHDFKLWDSSFYMPNVKDEIRSICNYDVDIIPHSVNIYTTGSHFKEHVDTPRYPNMIGTVVIQIRSALKGGDLIVEGKKVHLRYDNFVFFFTGKVHQVTPVQEGQRVTITFDVVYKESTKQKEDNLKIDNWFDQHIGCKWKEQRCAIVLHDVYSLDGMKAAIMKNPGDQMILDELKKRGIPFTIGRIIISREKKAARDCTEIDLSISTKTNEIDIPEIENHGYGGGGDGPCLEECGPSDEVEYKALGYNLQSEEILIDTIFQPEKNQVCTVKQETKIKNTVYTGNQYDPGLTIIDNRVYHTTAIFIGPNI